MSLVLVVAALALAGDSAAQFEGERTQPEDQQSHHPVVSPNWSGYAVRPASGTAVSFTSVTGTWRVPAVTCRIGSVGASSVVWVGIGGYGDGDPVDREVAQVGTGADCTGLRKGTYYAWFEIAPNPAFPVGRTVSPGDTIKASVNILPSGVQLQIEDQTRHWTFTRRITWAMADTSSAEWIVEAPTMCHRHSCSQARLANFGSVTMTRIAATGNTLTGTLANPAWTLVPIWLVGDPSSLSDKTSDDGSVAAGADPGPVSADGTAFSVSWIARHL
jgi:Peptidase A4 family